MKPILYFNFDIENSQYTELSQLHKYLLTIPLTQVTCEQAFSKSLKIIKTRLGSRLSDDNLKSFSLINCERDTLVNINSEVVIDRLSEKISYMRPLILKI